MRGERPIVRRERGIHILAPSMQPPLDAPIPTDDAPLSSTPSAGMELAVVALGGAIGASLRYLAYELIPTIGPELVSNAGYSTLIVNLSGAFLLGALYGRIAKGLEHPLLRPFLGVGVLGSFTTYSTLVLESSEMAGDYGAGRALALVVVSIVLGLATFQAGRRLTSPARGASPR